MGAKLEEAVKKAKKTYDLQIGNLKDFVTDIEAISTGNIALDVITGVGGLPRGRIIELYGPPSSGKTTTALQAAVAAQRQGLAVVYADYEQAIDVDYAMSLGLDMEGDLFYLYQPESFEQGINIARDLIATGEVGILVVDSVAAMVTEKELEAETGKNTFASQAKTMAQTMRQMTGPLHRTKTTAVFLNHIQDVIDSSPMGQRLAAQGVKRVTTPGGKALKFYASIRMEYKPIGGVRGKQEDILTGEMEDVVTQQKVQVTVVKNKVAAPFKVAEVRVEFGKGFSNDLSVLGILTSYGKINAKSGVYRFTAETQPAFQTQDWIRGEHNVVTAMEEHPEWRAQLNALAISIIESVRNPVKIEPDQDKDPEVMTDEELEADTAEASTDEGPPSSEQTDSAVDASALPSTFTPAPTAPAITDTEIEDLLTP